MQPARRPSPMRDGHVVGGQDLADLVPVRVQEVFLVVGKHHLAMMEPPRLTMPTRRRAAIGMNSQQDARVNGEVIDALPGLLDERVAIVLPREVFGIADDLFEGLVDRNGADGDGTVAQDPLARFVDVGTGGEVHNGVAAPAYGPNHLFELFFDGAGKRAVADVGVDLHQEVAADDHRFQLGMIDVCGDDGAASGDFAADVLRRDRLRDFHAPVVAGVVLADQFGGLLRAHVLADGHKFHFRRDDPAPGELELGHGPGTARD